MKHFKSVLCLLMALALVLSLGACAKPAEAPAEQPTQAPAPTPAEETGLYTPGTYEGEGTGNNGKIKMSVTVDANTILTIEPVEHVESTGISDIAFERIPAAILEGQTLAVDAIATATMSSKGILAAVTDALSKAGADIAKLQQKVNDGNAQAGETVEKTADVIVVGGGGAGLAAAYSAKAAGASVILVEKMPQVGGNTLIAGGGLNAADPARQLKADMAAGTLKTIEGLIAKEPHDEFEAGLQKTVAAQLKEHLAGENAGKLFDSKEFHMLQTYNGGDYKGKPEFIEILCGNALASVEWLESLGMEIRDSCSTVAGGLYQRGHAGMEAGSMGRPYIKTVKDSCDKVGVETLLDTRADEIIMENGKAVGVHAVSGADEYILHANKSVILATGGFAANVEMRVKYNTLWPRLDETILTTNSPAITGDGIVMAEKVGAKLINLEDIQCLPYGDPSNGGLDGLIIKQPEDAIYVNKEGKRFVSEYERRDVMSKALLAQTDAYMYIILDGKSYASDEDKTSFSTSIGEEIEAGRSFKGETLEELAALIGLDPAVLKETVDKYNAGVDAGVDEFGKSLMNKLDTPPYYANPRVPTVHHTMGGIEINTDCYVLNANGETIPGLLAVGEVTGGIHGTNRLGGNAIADIFVFGKIAGENAAK